MPRNWKKWGQEIIQVTACALCGRLMVPYFGIPGPCLPGHSHLLTKTAVRRSELAWELARVYWSAPLSERKAFKEAATQGDKDLLVLGEAQLEWESVTRR